MRPGPPCAATRRASRTANEQGLTCRDHVLECALPSGNSSVGRARPCQGRGREFESRFPLQFFSKTSHRRGFVLSSRRRCLAIATAGQWPGGRVVMQRTANPRTPVRFRPRPPLFAGRPTSPETRRMAGFSCLRPVSAPSCIAGACYDPRRLRTGIPLAARMWPMVAEQRIRQGMEPSSVGRSAPSSRKRCATSATGSRHTTRASSHRAGRLQDDLGLSAKEQTAREKRWCPERGSNPHTRRGEGF